MRNIVLMMILMLLISGCAKKPNGRTDIQMVIYQPAGFGFLPMPSTMPLRSKPMEIIEQADITAISDAVNNPDGKAFTMFARNNRLAFVTKNRQVVMYGITGNVDITRDESSKKLGPALTAALTRARITRFALVSSFKSLSYHNAGITKLSISIKNQALKELLACYCPLVLKGNRRCGASEIKKTSSTSPRFITIKLAKPDTFEAIVMTKDSEWPPKQYDTNSRLERVSFDTITIFSEGKGLARFVFTDTKSGECLFTDPVNSLRLVKKAQGRKPPVYGNDLFEEVVSEVQKSWVPR